MVSSEPTLQSMLRKKMVKRKVISNSNLRIKNKKVKLSGSHQNINDIVKL